MQTNLRNLLLFLLLLLMSPAEARAYNWYTHLWITRQVDSSDWFVYSSLVPDFFITPISIGDVTHSHPYDLVNAAHSPVPKPLHSTQDRWTGFNYDDTDADNKYLFATNASYSMFNLAQTNDQRLIASGLGAHNVEDWVAHQLWPGKKLAFGFEGSTMGPPCSCPTRGASPGLLCTSVGLTCCCTTRREGKVIWQAPPAK